MDGRKVIKARVKELEYIREKGVWKEIRRQEAKARGIKVIGTRWIDINKGDDERPNYRSRFVAKEYNDGKDSSLFASTPPLEALRMIVSLAATKSPGQTGRKVIMMNDVARAFFEAEASRTICVELPDEDLQGGESKE